MKKKNHSKNRMKRFVNNCAKIRKIENEDRKILNKISVKLIDNPVEQAIIYYNKTNKNYIDHRTHKIVLERITMNFLRHSMTNYDKLVNTVAMKNKNLLKFKRDVNKKIICKYGNSFVRKEIQKMKRLEREK